MGNNNSELIGKFINRHLHTDVNPVGRIIGTRGKTILILAHVSSERDESTKMEFIPGGFAGVCINNREQKWIYKVDENDTFEIRWRPGSESYQGMRISDKPFKFYDFNF